jgi:hypothetical protein
LYTQGLAFASDAHFLVTNLYYLMTLPSNTGEGVMRKAHIRTVIQMPSFQHLASILTSDWERFESELLPIFMHASDEPYLGRDAVVYEDDYTVWSQAIANFVAAQHQAFLDLEDKKRYPVTESLEYDPAAEVATIVIMLERLMMGLRKFKRDVVKA